MAACQRLSPSPSRVCLSTKNYANVEAAGFRLLRTTNEGFFFLLPGVKNLFPIYLFHLFSWCWAFLSYCICTSTIFFVKGWSVLYILEIEESIYRDVIGSFKWKRRNFEFEFFLCLDKIFLIKIRSKLTIFRVKFLS